MVAIASRSTIRSAVKVALPSSGPFPLAHRVAGSPSMAMDAENVPSWSDWLVDAVTDPSWARSVSAASTGVGNSAMTPADRLNANTHGMTSVAIDNHVSVPFSGGYR